MTEAERVLAELAKRLHNPKPESVLTWDEVKAKLEPYLPKPEPDRLTLAAEECYDATHSGTGADALGAVRAIIAREVAAAEPSDEALGRVYSAVVNSDCISVSDTIQSMRAALNGGRHMTKLVNEAQRLQDHMEQHHGICLQASQWDAAITALRQPNVVPGDLVDQLRMGLSASREADDQLMGRAAAAIQSLTAERDAALARVAALEAGLLTIADDLGETYLAWMEEGCDPSDAIRIVSWAETKARALLERMK